MNRWGTEIKTAMISQQTGQEEMVAMNSNKQGTKIISMAEPPSTGTTETVKYMKNWISTTISIVALGIAIVAIAKVAPAKDLNFDYYGAIIGVLSFLVTLLMGYQIYTVINVKKDMEDVRKAKEEIDNKLEEKSKVLTEEFKSELRKAAPVIMAIASAKSDVIICEVFKAYYEAKPGQLSKELSEQAILTVLAGYSGIKDESIRRQKIEELAKSVKYDEIVDFYTDFAKSEHKNLPKEIEPFILELIGTVSNLNENGD